jgi:hypothetical protein
MVERYPGLLCFATASPGAGARQQFFRQKTFQLALAMKESNAAIGSGQNESGMVHRPQGIIGTVHGNHDFFGLDGSL